VRQLEVEGFLVLPAVLDAPALARLKAASRGSFFLVGS
jgi:hypothetical protein